MFIGIDPGLSGAVAFLCAGDGTYCDVVDTPTLAITTSRTARHEYDLPGMLRLFDGIVCQCAYIEEAQAMPGQGVRSMFTFGVGFGIWLGILAALNIPYTRVRPAVWKKALGLGKDKEQCRLRAQQLFPTAPLALKKHHGRAEALLLAYYGWRQRI